MTAHAVVSREEWLSARKELLAKEKELTRLRDQLSRQRQALPWVKIDKNYVFESTAGEISLAELFAGKSQLIVYHFMFHPDWSEGCKSCSFWADNYDNAVVHLNHRDVNLVAVSRAPVEKLARFKKRMDWSFTWVSSLHNDFNQDFGVSFTPEQIEKGESDYNFGSTQFSIEEAPGLSVFYRDESGDIYHTYSCYSRGLDILNATYHYLDLVPKGRDESDLEYSMAWLHLKDSYPE